MRIHAEPGPVVQLLIDQPARRFRHEPERIADKINDRLAVRAGRDVKTLPKLTQRIFAIALQRVFLVGRKLHRVHLDTTSPISLIQKSR